MRDRLMLPILIPVAALAAIFVLILSTGKILLEMDAKYSTAAAIVITLLIMVMASVLAAGPRLPTTQLSLVAGLPVAALIGVGLYLVVRPEAGTGAHEGGPTASAVTSFAQVATDNAFSVNNVSVPANTEVTMTFENRGQAVHNWRVQDVKDKDGKEIKTELLSGGKTETLKFTVDKTGAYGFLCDVHPVEMRGQLTVVEGGAAAVPAAGGGAATGGTTVVGTDNKFNPAAVTVKANEEVTLNFENKGSAVHNWHVLNVKAKDGKDITTQLIPGGQRETVRFTIDRPGTYDVQCDVHPTDMRGQLTVQ